MMITCVAAFTLCWLPFNTFIVVADQYPDIYFFEHIMYVWFACHWLAMSHACYNPIIYIWMNSRFRDGFRYVLRFLPCVKTPTGPDFLPHVSGQGTLQTNLTRRVHNRKSSHFSQNGNGTTKSVKNGAQEL